MTEKQIKQKLRSLYKGWSLYGLTEQEQDIEFNKLLEQLTIPVVSKAFYCECDEPLEIQYEVGLTIYCENCGKNVKQ
jgi:hypothetical protein